MPKSKGFRVKTRRALKKDNVPRNPLSPLLQGIEIGSKVVIDPDPSFHKGMPHRRYFGLVGDVVGKRGRAFIVQVRKGKKLVKLIVRPEHLKKLG
jgi:large subunit ribosomal protein L21e